MTAAGRTFVDTNVLLHAHDASKTEKQPIARALLEERAQLSFWDALIIEAARRAGAVRLVSEDLQRGRVIAGVAVENPFGGVR